MNNNINKQLNKKHLLYRLIFRLIGRIKIKKNNYEFEMINFNS